MERAGTLAQVICSFDSCEQYPGRTQHRQHTRQSSPLGRWFKRGDQAQAIGRSRGGRTRKIHALANAQGKPTAFILTPGNFADISVAATLLKDVAPPLRLLGDKAYDADHLRKPLEAVGTEIVIPSNGTRRHPYPLTRIADRRRDVIERMFCTMKDWRRIAIRYHRLARNFLSAIAFVATACFWLT